MGAWRAPRRIPAPPPAPFPIHWTIGTVVRPPRRQHRGPHHDQARARPFRPADPSLTFGGNVFGWTVDEAGACSLLDAMVDAGLNFIDTADVYSRWAPGNQGGESETLIGKWIKRSAGAARCCSPPRSAWKWGPAAGPGARLHPPVAGSLAVAAADGLRGPVPVAPGRPRHAADRHAGRLRPADGSGQGARHRRVQLHVRAPVRGPDRQRAPQPAALRKRAA